MGVVYIAAGLLALFLLVGAIGEGGRRMLPEPARRVLGILLCAAWAVFLSVRCLAAAILAGHPGGSYDAALEQLGLWPLIVAWGSLAAGIFLLSSRKDPVRASAPVTETPSEPVEG